MSCAEKYVDVNFTEPNEITKILFSQKVKTGQPINWRLVYSEYAKYLDNYFIVPANISFWSRCDNGSRFYSVDAVTENMTLKPNTIVSPVEDSSEASLVRLDSSVSMTKNIDSENNEIILTVYGEYSDGTRTEYKLTRAFTEREAVYDVGPYRVLVNSDDNSGIHAFIIN